MGSLPASATLCNGFGHEQAIAEYIFAALLVLPAVQLRGHPDWCGAAARAQRQARPPRCCGAGCPDERGGGAPFQPWPAGVLFRARLSGLVHQRLCADLLDSGGRARDVATPVRLWCTRRHRRATCAVTGQVVMICLLQRVSSGIARRWITAAS